MVASISIVGKFTRMNEDDALGNSRLMPSSFRYVYIMTRIYTQTSHAYHLVASFLSVGVNLE